MKKIIFTALILTLGIFGCGGENSKNKEANFANTEGIKPYYMGEKFKLKSVFGNEIEIERLQNGFKIVGSDKILMFDVFGTFCPPCQKEAAQLTEFQKENKDKFTLIAFSFYETLSDSEIIEQFAKKYNAYYFIVASDNPHSERIVEQILKDIDYHNSLALPFKVIYKNGAPQRLTDISGADDPNGTNYYLGELKYDILKRDFERILAN